MSSTTVIQNQQSHSLQTPYESHDHDSVDVVITAVGGLDVPRAAFRGGALVGYRSAEKRPPAELPVDFVDWPFDCERPDYVGRTLRES